MKEAHIQIQSKTGWLRGIPSLFWALSCRKIGLLETREVAQRKRCLQKAAVWVEWRVPGNTRSRFYQELPSSVRQRGKEMLSLDESQQKDTQSRSRENPPGFTTSILKTSSPQIHSLVDSTITEQYPVYYCVLPSNVTPETGIPKWKKEISG